MRTIKEPTHKNVLLTARAFAARIHKLPPEIQTHGQIQSGGQGVLPPLEYDKLLYPSLEIKVLTPLEEQLDPRVQLLLEEGRYNPL